MKIVIVDAYTLNPGDLSWDKISKLGDIQVYDRTEYAQLVERCLDADIVLTNKKAFSKATMEKLPKLKMLAVTATGYNIIDLDAAKERGIYVCNVPDYGTDSVAQHTFALILEFANQIGKHAASVANGEWESCADFSYTLTPIFELKGKSLGLVGFGSIGKRTAEIARVFGMNVSYHTPNKKDTDLAEYKSLEAIFSESDFVSLHLPLKSDNKEFVNKDLLGLMKAESYLINTSRGQLINEQDLADALNSGKLAGAGLDVLSAEPPAENNPLLKTKNVFITPHNAWMSKEARVRIMEITFQNVKGFLEGNVINSVV